MCTVQFDLIALKIAPNNRFVTLVTDIAPRQIQMSSAFPESPRGSSSPCVHSPSPLSISPSCSKSPLIQKSTQFMERSHSGEALTDRFVARRDDFSAKSKISLIQGKLSNFSKENFDKELSANVSATTDILQKYSQKLRSGMYKAASKSIVEPSRNISLEAERILDAPGIVDDFYLNCLNWSVRDVLAIGLGNSVYLWNARNGQVSELCNLSNDDDSQQDYVASLSWIHDGSYLAVGSSDSTVQLWDVEKSKRVRMITGHSGRVSALAWNKHILSSGAFDGGINTHDVRIAKPLISSQTGHSGQICGLQWSYDGRQLASGSNDNQVHIWEGPQSTAPTFTFSHSAAVKAVSWCPWQANTLATGGGSRDRSLKFWNTSTGVLSRSCETNSQVSAICWSKTYRELISAHGYSSNSLCLWKYPSLGLMKEIPAAHDSRILHMAISPDGERVATVAADENLKIWKVFERPKDGLNSKPTTKPDRPLVTISHMTETSAKLKGSSPYNTKVKTENALTRR